MIKQCRVKLKETNKKLIYTVGITIQLDKRTKGNK